MMLYSIPLFTPLIIPNFLQQQPNISCSSLFYSKNNRIVNAYETCIQHPSSNPINSLNFPSNAVIHPISDNEHLHNYQYQALQSSCLPQISPMFFQMNDSGTKNHFLKTRFQIEKPVLGNNFPNGELHEAKKMNKRLKSSELFNITDDTSLPNGNYRYRNACKSIIRKMNMYVIHHKDGLRNDLINAGFGKEVIEDSFKKIRYYNNTERRRGYKKVSPLLINYAANHESPYSYILKVTLEQVMKEWEEKNFGRISKENISAYEIVFKSYYNKVISTITKFDNKPF